LAAVLRFPDGFFQASVLCSRQQNAPMNQALFTPKRRRMRTLSRDWRVWLGAIAVWALAGCASSEREAAKHVDMTSAIVQEASNLLAADKELARFPIAVDGFRGDMRLKGQVATEAQKERAGRIVWAVRGVRSVENDLQVTAQGQRAR
jgi:osmotically-inducible protein OsmY